MGVHGAAGDGRRMSKATVKMVKRSTGEEQSGPGETGDDKEWMQEEEEQDRVGETAGETPEDNKPCWCVMLTSYVSKRLTGMMSVCET